MTQVKNQQITEVDYSKPHAFELEQGRITKVCKCGAPFGAEIHTPLFQVAPFSKLANPCLIKADIDMPLFVIKPTDALAIRIIEYWYMLALTNNVDTSKLADTLEVRKAFKAWQAAHPDRVHNPD